MEYYFPAPQYKDLTENGDLSDTWKQQSRSQKLQYTASYEYKLPGKLKFEE